jgi:putative acyl-CoA dehydrogenase
MFPRGALEDLPSPSLAKDFLQAPPSWGHPWLQDPILREIVQSVAPAELVLQWEAELHRLGDRVAYQGDITDCGRMVERNHPQLEQYNAWGHRIDNIHVHPAWHQLREAAAQEGIVASAYLNSHSFSRILQMCKLYMYTPSSAIFACPLAMTDGAATVIRSLLSKKQATHEYPTILMDRMADTYRRLTSTDSATFWTSGQWMTERPGGSDVGTLRFVFQVI